jgi:hypothetical protein
MDITTSKFANTRYFVVKNGQCVSLILISNLYKKKGGGDSNQTSVIERKSHVYNYDPNKMEGTLTFSQQNLCIV